MTPKKYRLLEDRFEHKAGTECFEYLGYDYGLRGDDEHFTGKPHICCTLNDGGDGPFFTVPLSAVEAA